MNSENAIAIVLAYLLGGICTGYYLVRIRRRIDIRDQGSGGVGARNVGRILGTVGFIITIAGDGLKGALPILAVRYFEMPAAMESYVLVAVVVGHIWPLWLQFKGGRGVATAFGGYLALDWVLGLTLLGTALVLLLFRRGVILSGMAAFLLLPWIAAWRQSSVEVIVALAATAAVVVVAHWPHLRHQLFQEESH